MEGYCPDCDEMVEVVVIDNSFDHAFGTEIVKTAGCENCEAVCYEDEDRLIEINLDDLEESFHGI